MTGCVPPPTRCTVAASASRSEEHTSELQSQSNLVCRLLLEKKKKKTIDACVERQDWASAQCSVPNRQYIRYGCIRELSIIHARPFYPRRDSLSRALTRMTH